MRNLLDEEQVEDLLQYIGVDKIGRWKGNRIQFCCPIHHESHPSCGINIDFSPDEHPDEHYQIYHCFSCGASGTLPWLLFQSRPDKFKSAAQAAKFIEDRYHVKTGYRLDPKTKHIIRYEEAFEKAVEVKRFELPKSDLAPFKSGKETYQYFYDRGFDKADLVKFMVGRDLANETVTIPAFWEDGTLAGIVGRYISKDRPKNMRFKIYNFPKSGLIYPLDKVKPYDNTLIGVESMFDAMMMHKWGLTNTIAIMGDSISTKQARQIMERCDKFIPLFDSDSGGSVAIKSALDKLHSVKILVPTYLPPTGKDPIEWGEVETLKRINSARYLNTGNIPRIN